MTKDYMLNDDGIPFFPLSADPTPNEMLIKTAKSIISCFYGMKLQGIKPTKEDLEFYHRAIKTLEQTGEKYP